VRLKEVVPLAAREMEFATKWKKIGIIALCRCRISPSQSPQEVEKKDFSDSEKSQWATSRLEWELLLPVSPEYEHTRQP